MAINKKLIHFKTYQAFNTELEAGNILETSIVWIKETRQIYTHGQFYNCSAGTDWSSQIGTNTYDGANYISKETNLTDAAMQLDTEIKATNDNLAILNAASLKGVKLAGAAENLAPQTDVVTIPDATTSSNGLMPAADKQKVDGILTDGDGTSFLANDGSYKQVPTELSADYAPSDLTNEQLEPVAGDTFETAIGKLHKAILDNEGVDDVVAEYNRNTGHNTTTSLSNVATNKRLVIATISSNQSFTTASNPGDGKELHIIVKNSSSSDRTVSMPTTSSYVNMSGDSLTVPANGYAEINVVFDNSYRYIRFAAQS